MTNFGMKVVIKFNKVVIKFNTENQAQLELRNVTEIHYNYLSLFSEKRIAFESNLHHTGVTYRVEDVAEFETCLEDSLAEEF